MKSITFKEWESRKESKKLDFPQEYYYPENVPTKPGAYYLEFYKYNNKFTLYKVRDSKSVYLIRRGVLNPNPHSLYNKEFLKSIL